MVKCCSCYGNFKFDERAIFQILPPIGESVKCFDLYCYQAADSRSLSRNHVNKSKWWNFSSNFRKSSYQKFETVCLGDR